MKHLMRVLFCSLSLFLLLSVALRGVSAAQQVAAAQHDPEQWLTGALDDYFADRTTMKAICTGSYTRFKTDAMNVDMNGGMTAAAFHRKWGRRYNTRQTGIHEGFLVPLQDWNKITVSCSLQSREKEVYHYEVILEEQPSGASFYLLIKLVREASDYKIDDVQPIAP